MSRVTNFRVTNRNVSTQISPVTYDMADHTSYTFNNISSETDQKTKMVNKTVNPLMGESIVFFFQSTKEVKVDKDLKAGVNTPAKGAYSAGLNLDIMVVSEDIDSNCCSLDNMIREPLHGSLNIQWPKSPYITAALLREAIDRIYSETFYADGTDRIPDLMRGTTNFNQ